jgi:hypothetical protein
MKIALRRIQYHPSAVSSSVVCVFFKTAVGDQRGGLEKLPKMCPAVDGNISG